MIVEAASWAPEPTPSRMTFVVIGDGHFRQRQSDLLRQNDIGVREAEDAAALVDLLQTQDVDGAVVELKRGTPASLAMIETLRQIRPLLPVVVATAHPSVGEAVRIMQLGVDSYVALPGTDGDRRSLRAPSELLDAVMRLLERQKSLAPLDRTRCLGSVAMNHGLVGESEAMKALLRDVALVAPTKTTVLVLGETGSGKERIAQAIHQGSPRRKRAFVAVNCAALSESLLEAELFGHEKGAFTGAHTRREGRFKMADGGTLFLDEIGELSPALQVKLLRVLQEREFERVGGSQSISVDVRVVAATNRNLRQMVAEGTFRPDLFYRLNVMVLHVPALRERPGDLQPLLDHILDRLAFELGIPRPVFSEDLMRVFSSYDWPGNVRELENVIERLIVVSQGRRATFDDLPAELLQRSGAPVPSPTRSAAVVSSAAPLSLHLGDAPPIPGATFRELERYAILRTYECCGGSPSRTAEILGLSLRTVHYRLREYRGEVGRRRRGVILPPPPTAAPDCEAP